MSQNLLQKIKYFLLSNIQHVTLSYFKSVTLHFIAKMYVLLNSLVIGWEMRG